MFIDASALVAILTDEADGAELAGKIDGASVRLTSPVAIFEAVRGIERETNASMAQAANLVERFIKTTRIEQVEIRAAETVGAINAVERFGKGRHPAKLNMGDCFAYACAKARRGPLLCKGDDFPQTDIELA